MTRALLSTLARPAVDRRVRTLPDVRAWAATWWREAVPFVALTGVALVLRLIALDTKPFHHDESLHAWFSWRLTSGEGYEYDPVYHGPIQYFVITLANLVFGVGDYVARVPVALSGTLLVFLPFFVRKQLGTVAALTASLLLCLAPSFLYVSRFAREDIHVAALDLAMIVVLIRFFDKPRRWQPVVFLGLLAVAFATKETTYIMVFVLGLFFLGAGVVQAVRRRRAGSRLRDVPLLRGMTSLGAAAWAWGASTFLVVYTLLFTVFLTNPEGLRTGLWGSIDYWLSQQDVNRGGQPWFFYLALIPAYEWPIVLLGLAGIVVVLRRRTMSGAFILWMFVSLLAIYSWASERMQWLVIHPLLPLVLLAGIGAQALWTARRRAAAKLALAVVALAAVGALYSSIQLAYFRSADARELMVQVQNSDDVPKIRDEVVRLQTLASDRLGETVVPVVDSWGGTGWPWSWYLRDLPVGYYDMSDPDQVQLGPIVLVADPNHEAMKPRLEGYEGERFRLRVWWVPDWGSVGPGDLLRWAVRREPWSPTATMDEWLYVREDVPRQGRTDS